MTILPTSNMTNFFKDKNGNVAIWQWPNIPLWGWIGCKALGLLLNEGNFGNGLSVLSTALLFTWAYLEITDGASYFRRTLGAVIMVATIVSFFK